MRSLTPLLLLAACSAPVEITGVEWSLNEDFSSIVQVSWDSPAEATVEFRVGDEAWMVTPATTEPEALLLGIPYDSGFTFRVVAEQEGEAVVGEEHSGTTGSLPDDAPPASLVSADPEGMDPSVRWVLQGMAGAHGWTTIHDRQGRTVWARPTPGLNTTLYARPSYDGHDLLIDHDSYWSAFDSGAASQVVRMKIDGTLIATYDTPGLHHPFVELADGSIAYGAVDGAEETLDILRPDGSIDSIWDCTAFHAMVGVSSYCQSNTLSWNEQDDTFLFSLYSDETVIEIDHATGESLRWFGHDQGSWAFSEGSDAFYWQHGAHFTPAGTLLTSTHLDAESEELVMREYQLDEENEQLVEIWSFGADEGITAGIMGDVFRLPNGNTLHNMGSGLRLREVTPAGDVVWDLAWEGEGMASMGRSTPLEDLYAFAP
jgi:hypothetical protein